ncbi:ribonuclease III [Nakamurella silvestris]|nr:ribonuclease III [Nakamurella silvestris]
MAQSGSSWPDPTVLTNQLGVELDAELVVLALTHRSYAYEQGGLPTNERLEFLGDSVLGLVVTDALFRQHPDLPEGRLAKLRASIVNMHALAGVAVEIGLGPMLRLGKGEMLTRGQEKPSLLADGVEAILGAVYLQHGLETARQVVHRLFGALIEAAPKRGAGLDWKTSLQERTAAEGLGVPSYRVTEEGPDHAKKFTATVVLGGEPHGAGYGKTKKEAEQQAAAKAYGLIDDAAAQALAAAALLDPSLVDDTVDTADGVEPTDEVATPAGSAEGPLRSSGA